MPTVEIVDLWAGYRELIVLREVDLAIQPGEIVALLGRNGVGKSTLVSCVAGLLPRLRGTLTINETDTSGLPPEAIASLGLSIMPQGHRVFGSLTVHENLWLAHKASGGRGWSLDTITDALPVLGERCSQVSRTLSGGEQQMLMLGRMLAAAGSVCLLDEPTEGLAPAVVSQVEVILRRLRDQGCAVLLVEQRMTFALRVAQRIAVMSRGRIVFDGSREEFEADAAVRSEYLSL